MAQSQQAVNLSLNKNWGVDKKLIKMLFPDAFLDSYPILSLSPSLPLPLSFPSSSNSLSNLLQI